MKKSQQVVAIAKRVRSIRSLAQTSGSFSIDGAAVRGQQCSATLGEGPARVQYDPQNSQVTVQVGFSFEAFRSDELESGGSAEPRIDVRGEFEIVYEVDGSGEGMDEESLRAFAEINGRFNTMAYWREFLHGCLARVGLPPFLIPPFDAQARLRALDEADKGDGNSAQTEAK